MRTSCLGNCHSVPLSYLPSYVFPGFPYYDSVLFTQGATEQETAEDWSAAEQHTAGGEAQTSKCSGVSHAALQGETTGASWRGG